MSVHSGPHIVVLHMDYTFKHVSTLVNQETSSFASTTVCEVASLWL